MLRGGVPQRVSGDKLPRAGILLRASQKFHRSDLGRLVLLRNIVFDIDLDCQADADDQDFIAD